MDLSHINFQSQTRFSLLLYSKPPQNFQTSLPSNFFPFATHLWRRLASFHNVLQGSLTVVFRLPPLSFLLCQSYTFFSEPKVNFLTFLSSFYFEVFSFLIHCYLCMPGPLSLSKVALLCHYTMAIGDSCRL